MKKTVAFATALVLVVLYVQSVFGQLGCPRGVQWIDNGQNRSAPSAAQRTTAVRTTAGWTNLGNVGGVQAYRDERTGLEWTVTIGQVQSSGWGAPARALVQRYGFRLPSFQELSVMSTNGGFVPLNIRRTLGQYYETSDPNILGNAAGVVPGFRTPQQRQGTGRNWVIGVRQGGGNQGGGQVAQGKIKVHLIVVGDVNSNLRGAVMVSSNDIYSTLISGLGNTPFEYHEVPREDLRPDTILQFIKNCPIGKNDTVIFCYLGHGASDPNRGVF